MFNRSRLIWAESRNYRYRFTKSLRKLRIMTKEQRRVNQRHRRGRNGEDRWGVGNAGAARDRLLSSAPSPSTMSTAGRRRNRCFRRQRNRGYLSGGSRSGSAELKPAYRKTQNKRPETNCKQMVSGLLFCEDSKRNTEGFLPLAGLKYDKKITIWTWIQQGEVL